MGHARAIAAMDDYKLQMQIFRMIIEKELSVRSVEKMVKDSSEKKHQKHETANEIPQKIHDAKKILSEKLHSPVDVKYNNKGKGKIVISFNSDDELNNIIEKLK